MNAKPIPPETPLDDLHPSRFLKVSDLLDRWKVRQVTVTINKVQMEDTIPNPQDLDITTADDRNPRGKPRVVSQPVLYFATRDGATFPRGYLLSAKVDIESIKTATDARTVGDLAGKRITIIVGEHRRKAVLRISTKTSEA